MSNSKSNSFIRTMSLARPSIRKDVLTAEDRHEGYMEKQSPSFHKRWQKRYFVLDYKMLKYYK